MTRHHLAVPSEGGQLRFPGVLPPVSGLRIAISGSAGTGKTTLALALSRRLGLPLIPEAMRAYLEAGGSRLDRLPRFQAATILEAFRNDLRLAEKRLGAFVADNGILDLEAYAQWYGCGSEPDAGTWAGRYDAVVLLPEGVLPYEQDGIRQGNPHLETRFQALVEALALASSLKPTLLPLPRHLRTPEARVQWVVSELTTTGPVLRSGVADPWVGAEPA